MASLNKVMLIGRIGKDLELKRTQSNTAVVSFSLANSEKFKDRQGVQQEKTEWHNIVCWGNLAETVSRYTKKGSQVYVEGKLSTREWQDNSGVKRYSTEIIANIVQFLDSAKQQTAQQHQQNAQPIPSQGPTIVQPVAQTAVQSVTDDDLPF